MNTFQESDQFDTALLLTLREELQMIKAQNTQYELRFARLEDTIEDLARDIKKLIVLQAFKTKEGELDKESKKQSPSVDLSDDNEVDIDGLSSNWSYLVVKKGGHNNLLHTTIRELFEFGDDPIQFLTFLVQKRQYEVQQRLEQLQAEYQKLTGSQLQEHFRELWKSNYILLRKKQKRSWKEEVFLEAFDAFIAWLQA
jgi:hypothetical protein